MMSEIDGATSRGCERGVTRSCGSSLEEPAGYGLSSPGDDDIGARRAGSEVVVNVEGRLVIVLGVVEDRELVFLWRSRCGCLGGGW